MNVSFGYNLSNCTDMNLWSIDWQKNYIKFYWNNVLIRVIYNKNILNTLNYPMFLIINNGIDTNKNRKLEDMKIPNFVSVDFVKIWKKLD